MTRMPWIDGRQYENIDEMWTDASALVMNEGRVQDSRIEPTREIVGYTGVLLDTKANFLWDERRRLSPIYAAAEMTWYLSGSPIGWIKDYAPSYENYLEGDGVAHGAYGPRWWSQLDALIEELRVPDTRRAVLQTWDRERDLSARKRDIPCTLTLQFLIRNDRLVLITTMRSNDLWLGFPYDVFCFTTLQRLIAERLDVEPGPYVHQAGSLHLYERHWERSPSEALSGSVPVLPSLPCPLHRSSVQEATEGLVGLEERCREEGPVPWADVRYAATTMGERSPCATLAVMCWCHWQDEVNVEELSLIVDGRLAERANEVLKRRRKK